ncbi:MAG: hypothetical protein LDL31_03155, partial [Prosthecobacter sp.]|nr:hypothetical protein [Prosthecobacter sp.]
LFAEWKLDKATADKVRMIIYDRELEQRLWMMKPEASAPATWRASHSAKKAMKLLKDSELSNLIGPDRLKRLLQVDAKVLEEMKNSAND